MRRTSLVSLSLLVVMTLSVSLANAQDDPNDEEGVRGTFLSSRPGSSLGSAGTGSTSTGGKSTSGKSTSGKSTSGKSTSGKSSSSKYNTGGKSKSGGKSNSTKDPKVDSTSGGTKSGSGGEKSVAIGLGYSVFMRDNLGRSVRVDPTRTFRAGDRVRLNLESNIDGYLYVFYRENDGSPTMLFPDARLNGGINYITAHVPYEVPSSKELVESNRWFTFDAKPATENLYIIVSREPLVDMPTGADLMKYCTSDMKNCSVPVTEKAWAMVEAGLKENATVSKSKAYGQWQTANESKAVERGLGLNAEDPEPSIVRMAVTSKSKTLVTAIALNHN